jgi:hypothetical protein
MSERTSDFTEINLGKWKPAKNHSYEVMQLVSSEIETFPCGFGKNGKRRKLKSKTLLGHINKRSAERKRGPKMAVCITMYNENE